MAAPSAAKRIIAAATQAQTGRAIGDRYRASRVGTNRLPKRRLSGNPHRRDDEASGNMVTVGGQDQRQQEAENIPLRRPLADFLKSRVRLILHPSSHIFQATSLATLS